MPNNLLDLLPRFVTPEGVVILPEDMEKIHSINGGDIGPCVVTTGARLKWDGFLISACRTDRQAPFRDKNGKRVFERDIANYGGLTAGIIKYDAIGDWIIRFDDGQVFRLGYGRLEVTGMIPFGEER